MLGLWLWVSMAHADPVTIDWGTDRKRDLQGAGDLVQTGMSYLQNEITPLLLLAGFCVVGWRVTQGAKGMDQLGPLAGLAILAGAGTLTLWLMGIV